MNRGFRTDTRLLRWVGVIAPVGFWLLVLLGRSWVLAEQRTLQGDLFALVALGIGATIFSSWVFSIVDQRELEIRQRSEQLAALHDAGLALTTELDLGTVLQKVVDLGRQLVNAQYGALGVLDARGERLDQFITAGLTPAERVRIGALPRGHGLLGALIKEGKPLRISDLARDPRSVGFPPNHPPMHSLLSVPIKSKGRVFGNLYMTDKLAGTDGVRMEYPVFTERDQQVLEMFAVQAAIAIENAQFYRQTQQLAVLQERERFGMDLHDGIIQSIYAIGLMLEDGELRVSAEPQEAKERIARSIQGLNEVIRDIRNYILDLRPQRFQGHDLVGGLQELVGDLRANTFLNVKVRTDSAPLPPLSPEQTVEILHVVQEALANVRKHARASRVEINLSRDDTNLLLMIQDDGIGFDPEHAASGAGQGLGNMRGRARALGGEINIAPRAVGMCITLQVPLAKSAGQ